MLCPGSMMVHAKGMHHLLKDLDQLKHSSSSTIFPIFCHKSEIAEKIK